MPDDLFSLAPPTAATQPSAGGGLLDSGIAFPVAGSQQQEQPVAVQQATTSAWQTFDSPSQLPAVAAAPSGGGGLPDGLFSLQPQPPQQQFGGGLLDSGLSFPTSNVPMPQQQPVQSKAPEKDGLEGLFD